MTVSRGRYLGTDEKKHQRTTVLSRGLVRIYGIHRGNFKVSYTVVVTIATSFVAATLIFILARIDAAKINSLFITFL